MKTRFESAYGFSALELKYYEPLSNFAFNFNLRRYILAVLLPLYMSSQILRALQAGAYTRPLLNTRPLLSST